MAMKRERQWDMFDVATGACELDDYLFQRYSENDLQSKFWVEANDQVDELRPPPEGSKEQVVIPIQGPNVGPPKPPSAPVSTEPLPSRPPWEAAPAAPPLPSRPPWEAGPPSAPTPAPAAPAEPAPAPSRLAGAGFAPPATPAPAAVPPSAVTPPPTAASAPPRPPDLAPPPEAAPAPPSMEELLARFHQAAKAYEERSGTDLRQPEAPEESESAS